MLLTEQSLRSIPIKTNEKWVNNEKQHKICLYIKGNIQPYDLQGLVSSLYS